MHPIFRNYPTIQGGLYHSVDGLTDEEYDKIIEGLDENYRWLISSYDDDFANSIQESLFKMVVMLLYRVEQLEAQTTGRS